MEEIFWDLIPDKFKTEMKDAIIDKVSKVAEKVGGETLEKKISAYKSDAAFTKAFDDATQKTLQDLADEEIAQNLPEGSVKYLKLAISKNHHFRKFVIKHLGNPETLLIDRVSDNFFLGEDINMILPGDLQKDQKENIIYEFVSAMAKSVMYFPEFTDIYQTFFSRMNALSTVRQTELMEELNQNFRYFLAAQDERPLLENDENLKLPYSSSQSTEVFSSTEPDIKEIDNGKALRRKSISENSVKLMQMIGPQQITLYELINSSKLINIEVKEWGTNRKISYKKLKDDVVENISSKILIVGKGGAGKTVLLARLFLDICKDIPAIFLTSNRIRNLLEEIAYDEKNNLDQISDIVFLDGLNELHVFNDIELATRISSFIRKLGCVVASSRIAYAQRPDVKNIVLTEFDKVYEILPLSYDDMQDYYSIVSQNEIRDSIFNKLDEAEYSPLYAAMLTVIASKDQKRTSRRAKTMKNSNELRLNQLYLEFVKSWYQRELYLLQKTEIDIPFREVMKAWQGIAKKMHEYRVLNISSDWEDISSVETISRGREFHSLVTSLFRMRNTTISGFDTFIHPSLLDYFCAQEIFEEVVSKELYSDLNRSILFLPNVYEINVFVRELLVTLSIRPIEVKRIFEKLVEWYEKNLSFQEKFGPLQISRDSNFRNNVMYILGRLPNLEVSHVRLFEDLFNLERNPLVRYTIGMNGIYNNSDLLNNKIIMASINPQSELEQSIKNANLYCHLYYYGDIPDYDLPDVEVDWTLTYEALCRHFYESEKQYKPFWLIDFVTLIQLKMMYECDIDLRPLYDKMLNYKPNNKELATLLGKTITYAKSTNLF